jgi:hypothetical protein
MPRRSLLPLLASPPTLDLFGPIDGPGRGLEASGDPALLPSIVVDPAGLPEPGLPEPGLPEPGSPKQGSLEPRPLVVWGWHLLRVLEAGGAREVYVDERELSPREALLLALALEGRRGSYRWEEMRRIAAYCGQFGIEADDEVSLAVTGDSGFLPRVERYRRLSPVLRSAVDSAAIDLKNAERLSGLPDELLAKLLEISQPLSHSNRRKMLALVRELIKGRLMDPEALLKEIEGHRDEPAELLARLRRRRYPELSSMEGRIERFNRDHLGGTGVALEAPANFEGRSFAVSFAFSNPQEFRSRLAALRRAEDHLEELVDLL